MMYFKHFYLKCLSHASYMIGDGGEAVVVDPQRDVEMYLHEAAEHGLHIRYVIETHLHADFVSGHRELAQRAGARIVYGKRAGAKLPHVAVSDGDTLEVGRLVLRIMETPGHTPESICIVVEEEGRPGKVLTGDTLFIGDVGRPDLAVSRGFTPQQMATMLYASLHTRLLTLPDDVEVWPAHGAGSSCGRNISDQESSTIGAQRATNSALADMTVDAFVARMTSDLPPAPAYFSRDVDMNRAGASALESVARPARLSPDAFAALMADARYRVLDVRPADAYGAGHVPGAVNIGLVGQFAPWAGTLLADDLRLLLVAHDDAAVDEAAMRLARVGLETAAGYLDGGMAAWRAADLPVAVVPQIAPTDLQSMLEDEALQVIDVRRAGEFAEGHVPHAINVPLDTFSKAASHTPRRTAVICGSGYRSSIATSLLERQGFTDLNNVTGGTSAWKAKGLPVESDPKGGKKK